MYMLNPKDLFKEFCAIAIIAVVLTLLLSYCDSNKVEIKCTTPLVTIYDIDKTKAKFHLTCTDEQGNIVVNETLTGVQVGYITHKENKRILGMKGRDM